jgi:hypothetical protein
VTLVNVMPVASSSDWITTVTGDACSTEANGNARFDLVVSNSVIDHVGGHVQRQRFAELVERSADRHWIQTPYRYFPIEPHWLFPCMQFLPLRARAAITQHWPLSPRRARGLRDVVGNAASVELLSITEMRSYFPSRPLGTSGSGSSSNRSRPSAHELLDPGSGFADWAASF